MKIVVPTDSFDGLNSPRGAHFGRANFYTVVTLDNDQITEVEGFRNPGHTEGGCGGAVENIKALGADALIVAGIGGNPLQRFQQEGIKVYKDTINPTVGLCIQYYLTQKVTMMNLNDSCSGGPKS